jgi:hypothetical protein
MLLYLFIIFMDSYEKRIRDKEQEKNPKIDAKYILE